MIHAVVALLAAAHLVHADKAVTSNGGNSTSGVGAPSNAPDIKSCIDKIRLDSFNSRKTATDGAKKEQPMCPGMKDPSPYKFKKVDASNLPMQCPGGDLPSIKQALTRQLVDCKKASKDKDIVVADLRVTRDEYCRERQTNFC